MAQNLRRLLLCDWKSLWNFHFAFPATNILPVVPSAITFAIIPRRKSVLSGKSFAPAHAATTNALLRCITLHERRRPKRYFGCQYPVGAGELIGSGRIGVRDEFCFRFRNGAGRVQGLGSTLKPNTRHDGRILR